MLSTVHSLSHSLCKSADLDVVIDAKKRKDRKKATDLDIVPHAVEPGACPALPHIFLMS